MENKDKKTGKWSQEEVDFLIKNYSQYGRKKCSEFLNRTIRSVEEKRKKLKLKMEPYFKRELYVKYNKDVLEKAAKNALCYADVIRNLGIIPQAGNYKNIRNRLEYFKVDTSHFLSPAELTKIRQKNENKNNFKNKKDVDFYLKENSKIKSDVLKKKLFDSGIKNKHCELCPQDENWHGKKIILILDHINGVHSDNRLENLRIVCPNCNSTLNTNCSKNRKIKNKEIKKEKIEKESNKPSLHVILNDLIKLSYVEVGKKYGVSDNAIRKWIKNYGYEPPKKQHKFRKL